MNPRPLDSGALATLDALLAGFRKDQSPRFPDAESGAVFARRFEMVLTGSDLVSDYLHHLDAALGTTTPEGELPDENEIVRFSAEGLGWMTADRLAMLAIDRGAVTALHEMVFDVWSDYWWERNTEREKYAGVWKEPSERLAHLKSRLPSVGSSIIPSGVHARASVAPDPVPWAAAFGPLGDTPSTTSGTLDHTIPVPNGQVIWLRGDSGPLAVTLSDDKGQLTARTSPLPLLKSVQSASWLADAALILVRGTIEQTSFVFMLPSGFVPRYFVADYHSSKVQAVYAVALDRSPLDAEITSKLITAIAANLRAEDSARADLLVDAASRLG